MNIYFSAKGQLLRRVDGNVTATNSLLYLKTVFELDEDWSDPAVTKTAVFTKPDGTAYHVLLGSQECEDNEAYAAQEVLREGFFTVGLIGVRGSGDNVVRMTTNTVTVKVARSGALSGSNTDVTPSLLDQIEAELGECEVKSERVPYIGEDGHWRYYSYDDPEGWIRSEAAELIGVDAFLDDDSENPVQNKIIKKVFDDLFDNEYGVNLFDYSNANLGAISGSYDFDKSQTSWFTSSSTHLIPVESGQTYIIAPFSKFGIDNSYSFKAKIRYFAGDKVEAADYISALNQNNNVSSWTFTPSEDCYIWISVKPDDRTRIPALMSHLMVCISDYTGGYQPYHYVDIKGIKYRYNKQDEEDAKLEKKISDSVNFKHLYISNSDTIAILGDSATMSNFAVKDKAYISKLSQFSDYQFFNDAVNGKTLKGGIARIQNKTKLYDSAFCYRDIHPKYTLLVSYINDIKAMTEDEFGDSLRAAVDSVRMFGSEPIIFDEFKLEHPFTTNIFAAVAKEKGVAFWDGCKMTSLTQEAVPNEKNYYTWYWKNNHPGTRTNNILSDPIQYYLDRLERPKQSMKIYRLRGTFAPTFTPNASDEVHAEELREYLDTLRFDSPLERYNLFREISVAQLGLLPEKLIPGGEIDPDEIDSLPDIENIVIDEYTELNAEISTIPSEYDKLRTADSFIAVNSKCALVSATVPYTELSHMKFSFDVGAGENVNVYVRDQAADPRLDQWRYMIFVLSDGEDPSGINAGDRFDTTETVPLTGGGSYTHETTWQVKYIIENRIYCEHPYPDIADSNDSCSGKIRDVEFSGKERALVRYTPEGGNEASYMRFSGLALPLEFAAGENIYTYENGVWITWVVRHIDSENLYCIQYPVVKENNVNYDPAISLDIGNVSKRYSSFHYYDTSAIKTGHYVELIKDEDGSGYTIPTAMLGSILNYDRADFLITSDAAFNIANLDVEYSGSREKAYIRGDFEFEMLGGENLIPRPTFDDGDDNWDDTGNWGVEGSVSAAVPEDQCLIPGTEKIVAVDKNNYIFTDLTLDGGDMGKRYTVDVYARYYPPKESITYGSIDYKQICLQLQTQGPDTEPGTLPPTPKARTYSQYETVSTCWKICRFEFDLPPGGDQLVTLSILGTEATASGSSPTIQIAKVVCVENAGGSGGSGADGYIKPVTGIPKSDLASGVQFSLGLADTAVQPGDLAGVATSGSYTDLTDKPAIPTVPTKLSDLTDDLGSSPTHTHSQYLAAHQDISGKVDKVTGKGLSTNDYTDAEKTKLAGIESGAQVNEVARSDLPTKLSDLTDDLGSSPTHTHSRYLTAHQDVTGKEDKTNKVTSLSSSSTDTQYPSAKCVYDIVGNIESLLGGI